MSENFDEFAMDGGAADYTMTLGNLILMGYDTPEKLHLDKAHYPIFDERYRPQLNRKIVQHFATREIGAETAEMFIFYLGRTMDEQMPYFNQLYASASKDFDPFLTMDIASKTDSTAQSESSGKSSSRQHTVTQATADESNSASTEAKSTAGTKSSTKQNGLSYNADVPSTGVEGDLGRYASTASKSTGESDVDSSTTQDNNTNQSGSSKSNQKTTSDSNVDSSTDFTHSDDKGATNSTSKGFSGLSPSQLLIQWRESMINIDLMVIQALEPCFMGIWGSPDDMNLYQRGQGIAYDGSL